MALGHILFILYGLTMLSSVCTFTRYRRYALIGELVCFFVGVPVSLSLLCDDVLMVWMIINFCCCCLAILYTLQHLTDLLQLAVVWRSRNVLANWQGFLKLFVTRVLLIFILLSGITLSAFPDIFLQLLLTHPLRWLGYGVCYGVCSAIPQEFAYRTVFFDRYREIFPTDRQMILASSLLFCLAHLIFKNVPCLVLTFVAGLLLSRSYARYRNLLFVSLEHAVYGYLAFTIGLSSWFGGW